MRSFVPSVFLMRCVVVLYSLLALCSCSSDLRRGSRARVRACDLLCARDMEPAQVKPRAAPPPPSNLGDVVRVTWESFTQVGLVGFVWTGASQMTKKVPFKEGLQAAKGAGVRWGRVSAGFAGGTAAAVVVLRRKEDDKWCQMVGAAVGGLAAATSVDQIPSSVATFVIFSYFIGTLAERAERRERES